MTPGWPGSGVLARDFNRVCNPGSAGSMRFLEFTPLSGVEQKEEGSFLRLDDQQMRILHFVVDFNSATECSQLNSSLQAIPTATGMQPDLAWLFPGQAASGEGRFKLEEADCDLVNTASFLVLPLSAPRSLPRPQCTDSRVPGGASRHHRAPCCPQMRMVPLLCAVGMVQIRTRKGWSRAPCLNLPFPRSPRQSRCVHALGSHTAGTRPSGTVRSAGPSPAGPPETPQQLTGFLPPGHALLRRQDCLDLEGHKLALLQFLEGRGTVAPKHVVFHFEGERGQAPAFPLHALALPLVGCGHVGDHLESRGEAA